MWARIIFCSSVSLAVLVVILLSIFSPIPHNDPKNPARLDLSLYIQQPEAGSRRRAARPGARAASEALVFRRTLTEGPASTSRVVGKAEGFIIPAESFAQSDFNVVYLSFDTAEYSGSLSVHAKRVAHKDSEALTVVGGTGSFAFARGLAVFARSSRADGAEAYRVKLELRFPG